MQRKKVYQYDTNLNLINEWESVTKAAEEPEFSASGISECAGGRRLKTHAGFIWSYTPLVKTDERDWLR